MQPLLLCCVRVFPASRSLPPSALPKPILINCFQSITAQDLDATPQLPYPRRDMDFISLVEIKQSFNLSIQNSYLKIDISTYLKM
jgi:hypothetical protein